MGPYSNKNLLRYEETIRLHFDTKGKTAWLSLTNYGFVFGRGGDDANKLYVVTVGAPATETGALPVAEDDVIALKKLGIKAGEFKPCPHSISIGSMLDAIEVIKLQVEIITLASRQRTGKVLKTQALLSVIGAALKNMSQGGNFDMAVQENDPQFLQSARDLLTRHLSQSPGCVPVIPDAIAEYRAATVGFTAYFPDAGLIPQEERTRLSGGPGKTANRDTRAIEPILSGPNSPAEARPREGFSKGQWEFQWIVDEIDWQIAADLMKNTNQDVIPVDGPGRFHAQIARVSCFAFRGDDRNPVELKNAGGFLPGVTRRDEGYMQKDRSIRRRAQEIDETLLPQRQALRQRVKEQTTQTTQSLSPELDEYLKVMKNWSVMHLGVYTEFQEFRGYLSATKSTSIAKHFSNAWRDEVDLTTYCYVVRCRGGFHLQSTVDDPTVADARAFLRSLHQFNSYAEQEVAVAGAIWWEHVVGMRMIRCNKDGQFFFGPIFLREDLMWEENAAFNALFELLSGKSQGDCAGVIEPSYEQPPFNRLAADVATKGANAIVLADTIPAAQVRVAPPALTFGRQPVGTASAAQIVTLTSLGDAVPDVQSLLRSGPDANDFVVLSQGAGQRLSYSITFEPRPPFKPVKKRSGESGRAVEIDERSATLEIRHDLAGSPHKVSLKGTAAPAARRWQVSADTLDFGGQPLFTISTPKTVTIRTDGPTAAPIHIPITVSPAYDFSIDGDHHELHTTYTLRVTFKPQEKGKSKFTFRIECGEDKVPVLVNVTGTGEARKVEVSPSPKSLDFGKQALGQSRELSGDLKNKGNVPIAFDRVEISGDDKAAFTWAADEGSDTLEPGQTRRMSVTFCPMSGAKKYSATLVVGSDSPLLQIKIPLSGQGV